MSNVILWPFETRLNHDAERVLAEASKQDFDGVVICGYLKDGSIYMASSYADGGTVGWLLDRVKHELHKAADEFEGL